MKKLAGVLVVIAVGMWIALYNQPYVVSLGVCSLPVKMKVSDITNRGYRIVEASGSNAIYAYGDSKLLVESSDSGDVLSVYADTMLSESTDMSVYGRIRLGSSEEDVRKKYGEPAFDLGNNCYLFTKRFNKDTDDIIAIGTQDGKVIHTEILYEVSE